MAISIFTRCTLAALCGMEQTIAGTDPDYDGSGEGALMQFHAEPHTATGMLNNPHHEVIGYAIVDQFGGIAGYVDICEEAATFAYSVVTG